MSEPRTRPQHITDKKGKTGRQVQLMSNLFRVERDQKFHLYQYHVDFNPDVPNMRMRKGMLYTFKDLLGPISMFDGMVLFLPIKLEKDVTEVMTKRASDEENIRISIRFTNDVPPTSPICMQLYNITFKKILTHIGMQLIGRNYYNPKLMVKIPQHKLEIWPGYVTSILQFENSPMLIVDISHKILSMATVLDLMYEMYNDRRAGGDFQQRVSTKLIGQIVLTRYNNKTYRIDDIDWKQNPKSKFPKKDGTEISFEEYYKAAHNININDMQQPVLLSMPKKKDERAGQKGPICLIPELCTLTGLDDNVRQDFNVMKDLAQHTRISPTERITKLTALLQQINTCEPAMKELTNWNLGLSNNLISLNGRILPAEEISQQGKKYSYDPKVADWSKEMRGANLDLAVPLGRWLMIYTKRNAQSAKDLFEALQRVGPPMGMQVAMPQTCELPDDNTQTFKQAMQQNVTRDTSLVCCVLPTNRKDRYDAIKDYLCCENPVPSQMILDRTLSKKQMLMSVATKVAIQMNCKMGGEVWHLDVPLSNTMVVGIDTYHDSSKKGRSVAGVVATMNKALTKYYTAVSFQNSHEELVNGLAASLSKCLTAYHKQNGVLPERVIVFRDGVGDGQLQMVNDFELPQITECFRKANPGYNPKIGFVVVKKRISSRFFAQDPQSRGATNPPPGTIIDEEATRPEWFDYFIVSQSVRQGTVSPTHYNVIHDSTMLSPDHYQRLTYKLCHLYYNWPGTIRVPAPCQYAHKVAFLVGQSLHKYPHESLADKLYYL